jgi:hypothetical protein
MMKPTSPPLNKKAATANGPPKRKRALRVSNEPRNATRIIPKFGEMPISFSSALNMSMPMGYRSLSKA